MTRPDYNRRSPTRRHPRATSRRERSELAGPMREVVHIFEREGRAAARTGDSCSSAGTLWRAKRHDPRGFSAIAQAMFRPLSEGLAPKRAQCHYCGSGCERQDPAVLIRLFGGDKVP